LRKIKIIKIEGYGKEITVRELRVKDILSLMDKGGGLGGDLLQILKEKWAEATDLTWDDAQTMAPSELKTVYDVFKEVNADFFLIAASLGLTSVLETIKQAVIEGMDRDLKKSFADLSQKATSESFPTDIASLK